MSISRRKLFGKLNLTLFKSLESAAAFCKLRNNAYIELVHWLHQIWQLTDSDLHKITRYFGLNGETLQTDMTHTLMGLRSGSGSISDFSHHLELSIERAWVQASISYSDSRIRSAWLLIAIIENPDLHRILLSISSEFKKIDLPELNKEIVQILKNSPEENDPAHDGSQLSDALPGEASQALSGSSDQQKKSALQAYCTDLTQLARDQKIDPVVGRFQEIRTMVDILLRRRQNNPLLTGDAGVGKTAVVEGLALAIVHQQVPPELQNIRLLSLDVGALIAGASMRGEFESRLKDLLQEATSSEIPVILFIDEVHTLVGAGGQAGTGDAANLLKPALARGGLRTIGATTWTEYKKHIEKDPALTRRFQVLQILEPEELAAVNMVRGITHTFSLHHGVQILDEAILAAVQLSHRYIPSRQLPDKAISLLDTACARVAMSLHAPPSQIEFLRQKRHALELEQEFLLKEQKLVQGSNARVKQVQDELSTLEVLLLEKENSWSNAHQIVQQILAISNEIAAYQVADDNLQALALLQEKLSVLRQQLNELQAKEVWVYPSVDKVVIAEIISDWTGIPAGRMVKDEALAALSLHEKLSERVKGQDHSMLQISQRIRMSKAKITDPSKPIGVFMLVGPSGVGKTETAFALADHLYGGEHNLITINMSEFQEAHTVSSLKGAPPGYIGYGEGGVLTEAVRRRPYSVVLLDEVEKAHPDVLEVFYQVFDKGQMEDGEGRFIDFKNTLILLTSNAGSETITNLCEDPDLTPSLDVLLETLNPDLKKYFPTAFLGRVTVIPYWPLQENMAAEIVSLQLEKIKRRLHQQHQIEIEFGKELTQYIAQIASKNEIGARKIAQYLEQKLLPRLADIWLQNSHGQQQLKTIQVSLDTETTNEKSTDRQLQFQLGFQ
jgi:type VI secretion system protein VasG